MAEFVELKTKLTVVLIERPPIVSQKQLGFLVLALLVSSPFLMKRILAGNTLLHASGRVAFQPQVFEIGCRNQISSNMPLTLKCTDNLNFNIHMCLIFYQ